MNDRHRRREETGMRKENPSENRSGTSPGANLEVEKEEIVREVEMVWIGDRLVNVMDPCMPWVDITCTSASSTFTSVFALSNHGSAFLVGLFFFVVNVVATLDRVVPSRLYFALLCSARLDSTRPNDCRMPVEPPPLPPPCWRKRPSSAKLSRSSTRGDHLRDFPIRLLHDFVGRALDDPAGHWQLRARTGEVGIDVAGAHATFVDAPVVVKHVSLIPIKQRRAACRSTGWIRTTRSDSGLACNPPPRRHPGCWCCNDPVAS